MSKTYRAAKVRAASYDEEAGTVEVVWTTGAAVRRCDYRGEEYDEVLSLDPAAVDLSRLNAGAPLLDSHQDSGVANIVGAIVSGTAKIEDGRGIATVLLSKAADVANAVRKIIEGTARNISCGYWIEHTVRTEGDPPTVLVDRWTPLEISIVPIPADAASQVRSANGRSRPRARQTPAQRAAAYARSLLTQSRQSAAEARGAAEARKLVGGTGSAFRAERAKPAILARPALAAGAHEARKLLRRS